MRMGRVTYADFLFGKKQFLVAEKGIALLRVPDEKLQENNTPSDYDRQHYPTPQPSALPPTLMQSTWFSLGLVQGPRSAFWEWDGGGGGGRKGGRRGGGGGAERERVNSRKLAACSPGKFVKFESLKWLEML